MKSVLLAGLLLSSIGHAETKKVTVLADPWCPYTCEAGSKPGLIVDTMKAALKDTPYEIEYKIIPWARALSEVRSSKANAVLGATVTDKEGLVLSPSMGASATCFYAKKSLDWKYDGLPSLAKVSVGAVTGYTYDEVVDKHIEANKNDPKKVQFVSGDNPLSLNMKKLEASRVQVVIEDQNIVDYYVANNKGQGKDIESKGCLPPADVHIGFGEKHPMTKELSKAVEDGLKKIKANGEHAKILSKYGLK